MTAERFAAAAKIILDEDRRADRERIAELERDNATLTIQVDAIHEKCAALVVENKRLSEYASGNWVDVPPPSDAGCLYPECGPTCRRDCPPASAVETPAVVKRTPKVGDRVRVIEGANAGETATVRAIDSIDPDCFCLMLANGERWFAHVDNLEVIE